MHQLTCLSRFLSLIIPNKVIVQSRPHPGIPGHWSSCIRPFHRHIPIPMHACPIHRVYVHR